MKDDCIFCKIVNKEIHVKMIYENDNFVAFPDVTPQIKGHSLITSKKHFVNSLDMPASLGQELISAIKSVFDLKVKEDKSIEGFNLVQNNFAVAGQIVMHAHWHLLPRRKNDGKHLRLE